MGFRADIENISKDALEYLKRGIDGCKLRLVENLSLLFGDVVCFFVLFMLLFVAYLALMVTIVILLLPFVGLPLSIVAVAVLSLLTAGVVYMLRERLFVDRMVRHFARIFLKRRGKMGKDVERLCRIKSLRQLRSVCRANELARAAALERAKSGVAGVLSVSALLVALMEQCVPRNIKDVVERLFSGYKE